MGKRKRRKKKKVKDVSFTGRMDRATTRALKRMTAKTDKPEDLARHPLEKQSLKRMHEEGQTKEGDFQTPLGPVTLSNMAFEYIGPKTGRSGVYEKIAKATSISTTKENYGNHTVGHKYTDFVEGLERATRKKTKKEDEKAIGADLLFASVDKNPTFSKLKSGAKERGEAENAGAKILAASHISEQERWLGSLKWFRAVLRAIKAGDLTLEEAFASDTPWYPMARKVGKYYMAKLLGRTSLPVGDWSQGQSDKVKNLKQLDVEQKLKPHLSDSSEDESEYESEEE